MKEAETEKIPEEIEKEFEVIEKDFQRAIDIIVAFNDNE